MQLFFPGETQPPARLSLAPDGRLRIEGQPNRIDTRGLRPLLRFLMRLGCVTVPSMIVRVPTGHAVHYACTLPMKRSPKRYQCDIDGRLGGSGNVFIADSAAFSRLPAKNMSFAMMANAMRVAERVAKGVLP
jgi:choline dehydrogenase-like flavoprotein